jgi:hypothetical protein
MVSGIRLIILSTTGFIGSLVCASSSEQSPAQIKTQVASAPLTASATSNEQSQLALHLDFRRISLKSRKAESNTPVAKFDPYSACKVKILWKKDNTQTIVQKIQLIFDYLLDHTAYTKDDILQIIYTWITRRAIYTQKYDVLKLLINAGISLDSPEWIHDLKDDHGSSIATAYYSITDDKNMVTMIKWLVAHGANVNFRGYDDTLLMEAGYRNANGLVAILLRLGANPDLAGEHSGDTFKIDLPDYKQSIQDVWDDYKKELAKKEEASYDEDETSNNE